MNNLLFRADVLQKARKLHKISFRQLRDISGVSSATIHNTFRGGRTADLRTLHALAAALQLTMPSLFEGIDPVPSAVAARKPVKRSKKQ